MVGQLSLLQLQHPHTQLEPHLQLLQLQVLLVQHFKTAFFAPFFADFLGAAYFLQHFVAFFGAFFVAFLGAVFLLVGFFATFAKH